jgi:dTDP-glucose 4,6-dehydratase
VTRPLPPGDLQDVLDRVGPLWEDLRGARILLTGCTGFMGPWILETLLAAEEARHLGLTAWVLTRNPAAFPLRHPALRVLEGDVRCFRAPGPFTHLVHGAASSNAVRDPQGPDAIQGTIVDGTARVLEAAAGARKALFISSGAVYGPQSPEVAGLEETHPGQGPFTVYGEAKRAAEAVCRCGDLPVSIARCFAFLAPHLPLDAHFAAGNFLRDALAGQPIRVEGDGRTVRSYLYGTDLACWLWTILLKGEAHRAYNVGSPDPVTIGELARAVAGERGLPVSVDRAPGSEPAPRYVPSVRRARTELGLEVTVDLPEAIRRTLAWHGAPINPLEAS